MFPLGILGLEAENLLIWEEYHKQVESGLAN